MRGGQPTAPVRGGSSGGVEVAAEMGTVEVVGKAVVGKVKEGGLVTTIRFGKLAVLATLVFKLFESQNYICHPRPLCSYSG